MINSIKAFSNQTNCTSAEINNYYSLYE